MSNKYELAILDKENYDVWYTRLQAVFKQEKIFSVMTNKVKTEDGHANYSTWIADQGKGENILNHALSDADLRYVSTCETVADRFEKLKKRYNRIIDEATVNERLSKITWSQGESADDFTSKLDIIRAQSESAKLSIDDGRFIQIIRDNLPPFLNAIKSDLLVSLSKSQKLVYQDVVDEVCKAYDLVYNPNHKSKIKTKTSNHSDRSNNQSQSAFAAVNKSSKKLFCKYCNKKGHTIDRCFKLNNKKNNESTKSSAKNNQSVSDDTPSPKLNQPHTKPHFMSNIVTNVVTDDIEIPNIFSLASYSTKEKSNGDLFYYDSCASNMMCPDPTAFTKLEKLENGPIVSTANGETQVQGIGDIRVQSFNGVKYLSLVLRDVWYLPSLPASLFSEPYIAVHGLEAVSDRSLDILQRKVLNVITGAYRSTSSEKLLKLIGVCKLSEELTIKDETSTLDKDLRKNHKNLLRKQKLEEKNSYRLLLNIDLRESSAKQYIWIITWHGPPLEVICVKLIKTLEFCRHCKIFPETGNHLLYECQAITVNRTQNDLTNIADFDRVCREIIKRQYKHSEEG